MANEELKKALFARSPVIYSDAYGSREYKHVSAIIYRCVDGKLEITAEILDKNDRSVSTVNPVKLKFKEMQNK